MRDVSVEIAQLHAGLLRALFQACDANDVAHFAAPGYRLVQDVIAPLEPGSRGVRTFAWFFGRGFDERTIRIEGTLVEGERVVSRFSGSARHARKLGVLAPTGQSVHWTGLAISTIRGGLFTQTRIGVSDAAVLRQLGVLRLRNWVDAGAG